jgi:glycosyltransferase involved in cell wall biosynthesis
MSVARPRILVITKLAPWRLNGGALIRNYWMIDALAQHFSVDLFTADDATPAPAIFAEKLQSIQQFPRVQGHRGTLLRSIDALHPRRPLYAAGSVPPTLALAVEQALETTEYSAIQIDLNMSAALPKNLRVPVIYNAHNCEYALQQRRAKAEFAGARGLKDRFIPLLMSIDSERLARLETNALMQASLTAACSDADIEDLRVLLRSHAKAVGRVINEALYHLERTAVCIPNGVDTQSYAEIPERGTDARTLLITGSMDWRPNRMGLQWFLAEVLPEMHARNGDKPFTVRVAGRMDDKLVRELQRYPEITPVPNPARMQDELARANIVVAPITASSGTRLRILEAWAAKRPVITTAHGALGLEYTDETEMVVRDSPAEFADAILQLLDDQPRIDAIAAAALTRVAQYDWRPIGQRLVENVQSHILAPQGLVAAI